MLRLFRNLKIAEKLLLTELAMTLSMLLVFSIFALGNHYHNLRTHLAEGILLQMNVVTTSIGPAVMFGELGSATKTLEPLSDNTNIRTIVILDQHQHKLESLHPQHLPTASAWQWLYPFFGDMQLNVPIVVNEKTVGTLRTIIKQEQIVDMLIGFAWSNTVAAIAAALFGYFVI
jgi:c-di-GMP phosphodiesterase